jgi:hypothetical protein
MTERTPQSLNVILQSVRECRLTKNQVFRLWKCAVKDDDKLVDAVIEKLYRDARLIGAKRQRRGDVVTHALSQCNEVSRRQPPYSADPTKRQRRGDVVTHALSQCNDVSRQQRPKLFPDLHKGAVDGCLGRNAQFVDDEEKLPLCQYRFEQKKFSDPCGFRRHRSDLSFQAEV